MGIIREFLTAVFRIMEITVQQSKSYLPPEATITLSNNSDGLETIEIAVPFDIDQIDLSYPRLFATVKTVNNTWSANFTVDFLLLENDNGDYIFEVETIPVRRTQFRTKDAMLKRLGQIYSTYYNKMQSCDFDASDDILKSINEHFEGSLETLKIVDTAWIVKL